MGLRLVMKTGSFGIFALACCLGQWVLVVAVAQDSQLGVSEESSVRPHHKIRGQRTA
jgi:hypothetical protein